MVNAVDDDSFLLKEVKHVAREIAVHCTITRPGLGGRAKVGPKKVVEVLIWGRTWPAVKGEATDVPLSNGVNLA